MDSVQSRFLLNEELLRASRRDELFLLFQPCVEPDSERIVSTEALLRWRHPLRGIIPPDAFIPLAEEHGSITDIGKWVLQNACVQGRQWHDAGLAWLRMAVNISPIQLEDPGFAHDVIGILDRTGFDARFLEIEITETASIRDFDAVTGMLQMLKRIGVAISIDDFGSGYSWLSRLQRLPVDVLKIDKSFIGGITHGRAGRAIVGSLIHLAKALELTVVAEGVETQSQYRFLRKQRCDRVQGFLVGRPVEPEMIAALATAAQCPVQMPHPQPATSRTSADRTIPRRSMPPAWHRMLVM